MRSLYSNAVVDQRQLLEKKSTRTAIDKVERDSASLIVQRDSSSLRTYYTDNLSKLSLAFGFDNELRNSKVYDRAWRNTLISSLRLRKAAKLNPSTGDRPAEQLAAVEEAAKLYSGTGNSPAQQLARIEEAGESKINVLLLGLLHESKNILA